MADADSLSPVRYRTGRSFTCDGFHPDTGQVQAHDHPDRPAVRGAVWL